MFRSDLSRSGTSLSQPLLNRPAIKWKFDSGAPIASSAAIANGCIFIGSSNGILYCLNQETGKEIWTYKTGGPILSTAAVNSGKVFFGSHDGNFYALDARNGELIWQFKTAGEKFFSAPGLHGRIPKDSLFIDDWDFYQSSPAIDDGAVFFGTGSGYLYALDKSTGQERWKFQTGGVIHASPTIGLGNIYFGSWDSFFYALDAKTGNEKWKTKTGIDTAYYNQTGFQSSALLKDSTIFIGCRDSKLYALNAINGQKIWEKFNDYGWVSASPVVHENKLIYLTGDTQRLVGVNKINGDSLYSVPTQGMIFSSPALVQHYLYYGELNGFLTASDATTGKKIWSYQLESSKHDKYKVLSADSTFNYEVVFSKEKQKELHKTAMELIYSVGAILSSPVIADQVIYVGSTDGNLYAFH